MALSVPSCQAWLVVRDWLTLLIFIMTFVMKSEDERKARLAQALRDNLRRRKGQAREQTASDTPQDEAVVKHKS